MKRTGLLVRLGGISLVCVSVVLITQAGVRLTGTESFWSVAQMCAGSSASWATGIPAIDFLAGDGAYMARTHCMVNQAGQTDWFWVWSLVGLNLLVIAGYLKIFFFWRKAYLQEEKQDRNNKLMELAWIFLFCACCGYISSIMLFFWPGYRLLAIALIPLAFFTWKFASNLEGFRISLSAKRLARQLNESLQQQNERLTAEVEHATRDLVRAKAVAEKANRAKSDFLARMSHEIRTPLTAIMGYLDIVIDETPDQSEHQDHLQTVRRNSAHLLNLINDVLDVSKIEAGEMAYEFVACSIGKIADEVVSLLRPRAEEVGTRLLVELDPVLPDVVMTDPTRVRQLITNLIGNAIKFTSDGEIVLRLEPIIDAMGEFDGLRITVRDTGIGMTPEQAEHVFEMFTQGADDISRRFGGTGLGLTISRRIARDLGGDVSVRSEFGAGSEFVATVRCRMAGTHERTDSSETDAAPDRRSVSALRGKRILLVEDSPDNIVLIRHRFAKIGVEIECAEDGMVGLNSVLDALQQGRPFDLVIMDINMPTMNGLECLRRIRASGCEVPVIMLSAHAMVEQQRECYAEGASAYCCKPIDFDDLFDECEHVLRAPSRRRAG